MPKSILRNPGKDASAVLFGNGILNMTEIARRTRIPPSSIRRYEQDAGMLRLQQFARCCEETGMTDADIIKMVKMFYRRYK